MVATITDSFVKQFSSNIHDLLEQKGSKLMGTVDVEQVTGEKAFFERIGSLDVAEITSRHADTTLSDPAHSRRMLTIKDYAAAVMLDHQDKIKMLIEPTNNYAKKLAYGMGRKMDDIIIDALYGSASAGADGGTSVAFDTSNQQIAAGGTGLTFEKLNQLKRIFMANEYDGPIIGVIHANSLEDLLAESEIQSIDSNSVKALVRGEVDTFMGIKFIVNNRIPDVSAEKNCLFYAPEALKLGVASDLKVQMAERADKNHNMQVHVRSSFGAVRMEEELVVSVLHT